MDLVDLESFVIVYYYPRLKFILHGNIPRKIHLVTYIFLEHSGMVIHNITWNRCKYSMKEGEWLSFVGYLL